MNPQLYSLTGTRQQFELLARFLNRASVTGTVEARQLLGIDSWIRSCKPIGKPTAPPVNDSTPPQQN